MTRIITHLQNLHKKYEALHSPNWLINKPELYVLNLIPQYILSILMLVAMVASTFILYIVLKMCTKLGVSFSPGDAQFVSIVVWIFFFTQIQGRVLLNSGMIFNLPYDFFKKHINFLNNYFSNVQVMSYLLIPKILIWSSIFIPFVFFEYQKYGHINFLWCTLLQCSLAVFSAGYYFIKSDEFGELINLTFDKMRKYFYPIVIAATVLFLIYMIFLFYFDIILNLDGPALTNRMQVIDTYYNALYAMLWGILDGISWAAYYLWLPLLLTYYYIGMKLLRRWAMSSLSEPIYEPSTRAKIHFKNTTIDPSAGQKQGKQT